MSGSVFSYCFLNASLMLLQFLYRSSKQDHNFNGKFVLLWGKFSDLVQNFSVYAWHIFAKLSPGTCHSNVSHVFDAYREVGVGGGGRICRESSDYPPFITWTIIHVKRRLPVKKKNNRCTTRNNDKRIRLKAL